MDYSRKSGLVVLVISYSALITPHFSFDPIPLITIYFIAI